MHQISMQIAVMEKRLDEINLTQFSTKMYGWTAERAKLSKDAKDEICELLKRNAILCNYKDKIVINLDLCFGSIFESVEDENRLTKELEAHNGTVKSPKKLGSQLRKKCDQLIATLEACERKEERIMLNQFINVIKHDEILQGLISSKLREKFNLQIRRPLDECPKQSAIYFMEVLTEISSELYHCIKRGPVDVRHKQIAVTTASILADSYGKPMGRTFNNYEGKQETGIGVEICRILARELNEQLPQQRKRKAVADMGKAYRRALEKLKSERS